MLTQIDTLYRIDQPGVPARFLTHAEGLAVWVHDTQRLLQQVAGTPLEDDANRQYSRAFNELWEHCRRDPDPGYNGPETVEALLSFAAHLRRHITRPDTH